MKIEISRGHSPRFSVLAARMPHHALNAATAAVLLVAATAAQAQSGATQIVAVTATRLPLALTETVADVTVLTRDDLDRATGRTLVEVLAQQPGLQFASYGGLGKTSTLFIRGLEARHTVLLIDGVRLGSATLGLPSLDNLPLGMIDHIEIARGPLSSLYGGDAAGGVVQVFTRRAGKSSSAHAELAVGALAYRAAAAGFSGREGALDLALDAQHTENRGFSAANASEPYGSYNPDTDGFTQDSFHLGAGLQIGADWRVQALALHSSGLTRFDDGPDVDSRARLVNDLAALDVNGTLMPGWRTRVTLTRATDGYDTIASTYGTPGNTGTVETRLAWENTVDTPIGTALAVLESARQSVSSPDGIYDVTQRRIQGASLALDGHAGAHNWQASVRRDRNSQFGTQNTGGLAYAYALTPQWRVGASWGSSFVTPSFNQLYYHDYGNPLLQPERGHSTELNARWSGESQSLHAALYQQRIRSFITSGPQASNLPLAQVNGLTLAWDGRVDALALTASIDHLDPRSKGHVIDFNGVDSYDKLLPRRAANTARLGADWTQGRASVGALLTAAGHRYDDAANTVRLGGYGTVDLHADWHLTPEWTLGAKLDNAGDKRYETAQGYNQPGREAYLTLRYLSR